jgi:segregation and condensation protein B
MEKGLIEEVGRKKTLGRPKLYGTTEEFLKKTSLNSISDLPPLKPD